jgi:phosphohistidine phosphatase SixA
MQRRQYVRNGHMVSIAVSHQPMKGWCWSYTIDGANVKEMRERPFNTAGAARLEAEMEANATADQMKQGAYTN